MTTLTSPECPRCHQPTTGVYNKSATCIRCGWVAAKPVPTTAANPAPVPVVAITSNAANPTSVLV